MYSVKKIVKETVRRFFLNRGYSIHRIEHANLLISLLHSCMKKHGKMFFVQIGANDGKSYDPIYDFVTKNYPLVKGIVVEPLGDFFQELKANYSNCPGVVPVNAAIHNSEKEMTLYRVDPKKLKQLPDWCRGIASFNVDHHRFSRTPEDVIVEEKVKCLSLAELLEEHRVDEVDLLQIDVEGYDAEIILNIDFNTCKPKIINFEHGRCFGVMSREKLMEVVSFLQMNGYEVWADENDSTAYRFDVCC